MIYLDHQATTPVDPRVLDAMLPFFCEKFGNAGSHTHRLGWEAEAAVTKAREQVARLLGAGPEEIVWTSGATEANNLAILGVREALAAKGDHMVTQTTEHRAVLDVADAWERSGGAVTRLPVDGFGLVDPEAVRKALTPRTVLISVMHANNEVGTIQDLASIGAIAKEAGVYFHSDAAQSAGKIPLDVQALGLDLVSLSAHKAYGPKGVGALYVRRKGPRVRLAPRQYGGGQERGLRSGTLPVPLIVAMGEALALSALEMEAEAARLAGLRSRLFEELARRVPDLKLNGHPTRRLPGNLNVAFPGVRAGDLMTALGDFAVSSGSACTSADPRPSHVLTAMGLGEALVKASVRFGLGRATTTEHVDAAAEAFGGEALKRIGAFPTCPGPL